MKRLIDKYLLNWKVSALRQPLVVRGARQVGKTYSIRKLGTTFDDFIEINFEEEPHMKTIFEADLKPKRIIQEISLIVGKNVVPGRTLLFFDEIQEAPKAYQSLRYFYEQMPELRVIAAGSLLEFMIQKFGEPVGRIESLFLRPLSFVEFLAALEEYPFVRAILSSTNLHEFSEVVHKKGLRLVAEYMALGGMPAVVSCWQSIKKPRDCSKMQKRLLNSYKADFGKYARKLQIKYVDKLFREIPRQIGAKFKFSRIGGEYRKRELSPALELLELAGVVTKVFWTAGQGIPVRAQSDPDNFKVIFLDVGLAQSLLSLDLAGWFLHPYKELINKGTLVESFVGQEFLAYQDPSEEADLYYWHRKDPSSSAEVDYIIQQKNSVIPVEVKAGAGTTLKSMHIFLETHTESPYGIRFSSQNFSVHDRIHSYPLYAISQVVLQGNEEVKTALEALLP